MNNWRRYISALTFIAIATAETLEDENLPEKQKKVKISVCQILINTGA
jgi:hypothetical protein